ncbi:MULTISPECIES: flagellar hook-basal body complex protein FliE [Pseudomonadaceae]|uniref:Flagellar hook-basal body complex protein FliE n=1 Tax=Pseudomonas denitrificans TaxID=43306 RepID=A0A9X7N485_PSEDE|nr:MULTISPECIES: flagellar hook-basal body complex protein FliE [Pseudomonadaceae]OQR31964.1 flagellar hook-basal body protein FliE [Pseudomonas sp. T]MBD9514744.1 flagellar hook-basal body complex protein FliE [Pseudomonas sp. PDM22]MBD9634087.1 flagellar hook-basal body complex protein FliE [Pseudomonas sp. PDM19]MBD9685606.1 flagellar hook-basal body complex protein FliE [Pseudomonas sp. PDM20]QEY74746.1 flagellar hook-basal body complex protein FliE [Pseudomonas denitrificans (nom. rej.)]
MSSIMQVQQDMLDRMNRYADLASGPAVRPAAQLSGSAQAPGIGASFEQALRSVDAEQHKSSAAMAAVDSGQSEDLVGAMIQSQKASVSFSALLQVRNKLTGAFDDIIRMPL